MRKITRDRIEEMRRQYPIGSRIVLHSMGDDPDPIPPGTEGKLAYIDDAGQIGVDWSNGRSLSLIPGEDDFSIQPPEEPQKEPPKGSLKEPQKAIGTRKKAQRGPQR